MKNFKPLFVVLIVLLNLQFVQSQNVDLQGFALSGKNPQTILLQQTFTKTSEIFPFEGKAATIYGLAIKADIAFTSEKSQVRIILVDKLNNEYLVYESYPLLEETSSFSIDNLCEETSILDGVKPQSLKIELTDASLSIGSITYSSANDQGIDVQKIKKEKKDLQNKVKINQINHSIKAKGLAWVAGETQVSSMTYAEKKKLFGQSTFTPGIEYYVGGVIQTGDGSTLKSATTSAMVGTFDWRNRHGKNWLTSTKDQGLCGSCWAFASTGATEALVNLFYNQPLNMNLSEQTLLSCSDAGSCSGGFPSIALDYIKNTGIVNEEAFPYTATDQPCTNKSASPTDQIKIGGRVDFGSSAYPVSEDNLKKMIVKYGPLSGGLTDWSHAMTLVGWQVVKEGDRFFYRNLNKSTFWYTVPAGSTLIGKTVWIFKNSWGVWGDGGYVYVETDISNFAWTHALLAPVQSLKQNYTVQYADNDHDGYYWWGLGAKPAGMPACPDTPDGNDADATLGPLDSYGNCIPLNSAPAANFTANTTSINENGSVNFTDLSVNAPTTWSWTFDGGTPSTSTANNPVVTYKTAGTYNVTLVVTNVNGSNTMIKTGYLTVNAFIPTYCTSKGDATKEWISQVSMNGSSYTTASTGTTGYANLTADVFNVNANNFYSINLVPKYSGKANYWYWSVWIDLNHDYDFNDPGEQVLVISRSKTAVLGSITIPSTALTGPTRMRVSMKRDALALCNEVFSYGEVKDFTINIAAPLTASPALKGAEVITPGIDQSMNFSFYPNPVEQVLHLQLEEIFEQASYSIYNVQGALLSQKPLYSNLTHVDVSNLHSGIYIIKVKNGTQSIQEKFIKR
ncbi:MAG TPA: hypothetical protein DCL77_06985 [Prolixibacteraceae bacterium]|nr:hypothetical protein [Prolixibacteraceae bacterium]